MKRRLKEMEEEAAALRDMQAKVAKEMQGYLLCSLINLPVDACSCAVDRSVSICFVALFRLCLSVHRVSLKSVRPSFESYESVTTNLSPARPVTCFLCVHINYLE